MNRAKRIAAIRSQPSDRANLIRVGGPAPPGNGPFQPNDHSAGSSLMRMLRQRICPCLP